MAKHGGTKTPRPLTALASQWRHINERPGWWHGVLVCGHEVAVLSGRDPFVKAVRCFPCSVGGMFVDCVKHGRYWFSDTCPECEYKLGEEPQSVNAGATPLEQGATESAQSLSSLASELAATLGAHDTSTTTLRELGTPASPTDTATAGQNKKA